MFFRDLPGWVLSIAEMAIFFMFPVTILLSKIVRRQALITRKLNGVLFKAGGKCGLSLWLPAHTLR